MGKKSLRKRSRQKAVIVHLVNVTPHDVDLLLPSGRKVTIPRSGMVARASVVYDECAWIQIDGEEVPIRTALLGEIHGLPDPVPGVLYIGSSIVAMRAAKDGRNDVVAPDTGDTAQRDESGRIVAVRGFVNYPTD